jgi:aquaporin Z
MQHAKKYVSEFLGTFALVFVGAGAVVVEGHTGASHGLADAGKLGVVGIALAHGLTLTAMIYAFGSISGGHFNPAVSIGAWFRKRLGSDALLGYVLSQLLGGLVAAMLLALIFPDEVGLAQLGTPGLGPRISGLQGFAIEGAITFLLTVVVLSSTRKDNGASSFAGLAIGATLIGIILFAGPLTGAAANPARYLGPALVSKNLDTIWLYVLGPIYGGILGSFAVGLGVEMKESASSPAPALRTAKAGRSVRSRRASQREEREEPEVNEVEVGTGFDEIDTDPPSDVFSQPAASMSDRAHQVLRKAQELYWGGNAEKAASTLVPLLARAARDGRSISEQVRSLLMVIEDSHGPLAILDRYRLLLEKPQVF